MTYPITPNQASALAGAGFTSADIAAAEAGDTSKKDALIAVLLALLLDCEARHAAPTPVPVNP